MELLHAVALGAIQGVTEFLPISSSGHLVLLQSLFGIKGPEIFFDVALHVGTLASVCVFFSKDLKEIAAALFSAFTWSSGKIGLRQQLSQEPEMRLLGLIIVGTVPTVLLAFVFRPMAEMLFSSVRLVGIMLLVTGLLLWFTRGLNRKGRNPAQLTFWDAVCVGLMQGLAILPGISRSGTTIATALFRGIHRETAARYSFLLSIPAIVGAMALELYKARASVMPPLGPALLGACVAAVAGYAALKVLIHLVKRGNLYTFAPYCWLLGVVVIAWSP
ncbi:MAG: undecaprenyl-diphosphate phosphatase [Desulfobacterales bacterium]|nr:undecaprenyl-diphosphate phosphatase [Desulfobacterales bacterium]